MNRGFRYYYKNGIKRSREAIINNKGILAYYFYFILSLLAKVTLIFAPVFSLADVALAKNVKKDGRVSPLKAVSTVNTFKACFSSLMTMLLKLLVFLAGIVVIALIIALLYLIASIFVSISSEGIETFIAIVVLLPGVLLLLAYIIVFPILFAATSYIIEANPGIGFGRALLLSFNTLKSKGKRTYLASFILPRLINFGILLGTLLLIYLVAFLTNTSMYSLIWTIVSAIVFGSGFLYVSPIFEMTANLAVASLFEDIFDYQGKENVVKGVNIRSVKVVKIKANDMEKNLVSLFDNTSNQAKKAEKKKEVVESTNQETVKEEIVEVKQENKKSKKEKINKEKEVEAVPVVNDVVEQTPEVVAESNVEQPVEEVVVEQTPIVEEVTEVVVENNEVSVESNEEVVVEQAEEVEETPVTEDTTIVEPVVETIEETPEVVEEAVAESNIEQPVEEVAVEQTPIVEEVIQEEVTEVVVENNEVSPEISEEVVVEQAEEVEETPKNDVEEQ